MIIEDGFVIHGHKRVCLTKSQLLMLKVLVDCPDEFVSPDVMAQRTNIVYQVKTLQALDRGMRVLGCSIAISCDFKTKLCFDASGEESFDREISRYVKSVQRKNPQRLASMDPEPSLASISKKQAFYDQTIEGYRNGQFTLKEMLDMLYPATTKVRA